MAQYVYDKERQTMVRPGMYDPRSRGIVRDKAGSMGGAGFSTAGTGGPEARTREAQAKMAEDAVFNQRQNQFKQTFGRGLTDGQASRRGSAGKTTQVPAGAMPQQQTYWENKQGQSNNRVELSGMMNRGIQRMVDGDKEGVAEFLKGYNDGPWSSRTDAKDVVIKDGMVTLIGEDGNPINTKPVAVEELQNLSGNVFTGQNVYQRDAGASGAGQAQGQGMRPQSKSAVKAAEVVGSGNIDKFKSELKALNERASVEKMTPELQAEIENANANLDNAVNMAGKNIYGAGMQDQQQQLSPANDLKGMMDAQSNLSDDEVRQQMWDKYGDQGVMRVVEGALQRRGSGGGMAQQAQQQAPQAQPGQGFGGDVPIGPAGQPDVLQQQPTATPQAQPQLTQNAKVKSNLSPKAQARQRDAALAIIDKGIQPLPKAKGSGRTKGQNIKAAESTRRKNITKVQRAIDLGMLAGEQLQKARDFVNQ